MKGFILMEQLIACTPLEVKDRQGTCTYLYEQFYHLLYGIALQIVKDHYLAQDVLQETFIKAYRHLDDCRDRRKVRAWLTTVTKRTAIDFLRKRNSQVAVPIDYVTVEETAERSVEETVENELIYRDVLRQMERLAPNYRKMIVLKYVHELKETEIAARLGVKHGTVKSTVFRARRKMRALCEKSYYVESHIG